MAGRGATAGNGHRRAGSFVRASGIRRRSMAVAPTAALRTYRVFFYRIYRVFFCVSSPHVGPLSPRRVPSFTEFFFTGFQAPFWLLRACHASLPSFANSVQIDTTSIVTEFSDPLYLVLPSFTEF